MNEYRKFVINSERALLGMTTNNLHRGLTTKQTKKRAKIGYPRKSILNWLAFEKGYKGI